MDFERLITALNDYVIVASVIVIAIRNSINCAALVLVLGWKITVECPTTVKQIVKRSNDDGKLEETNGYFAFVLWPLNVWIWLADERSEVWNYFQENTRRT